MVSLTRWKTIPKCPRFYPQRKEFCHARLLFVNFLLCQVVCTWFYFSPVCHALSLLLSEQLSNSLLGTMSDYCTAEGSFVVRPTWCEVSWPVTIRRSMQILSPSVDTHLHIPSPFDTQCNYKLLTDKWRPEAEIKQAHCPPYCFHLVSQLVRKWSCSRQSWASHTTA